MPRTAPSSARLRRRRLGVALVAALALGSAASSTASASSLQLRDGNTVIPASGCFDVRTPSYSAGGGGWVAIRQYMCWSGGRMTAVYAARPEYHLTRWEYLAGWRFREMEQNHTQAVDWGRYTAARFNFEYCPVVGRGVCTRQYRPLVVLKVSPSARIAQAGYWR